MKYHNNEIHTINKSSPYKKYYKIKFKNNCTETVKILINYKNNNEKWITEGWWQLKPNKSIYLRNTPKNYFYYSLKSLNNNINITNNRLSTFSSQNKQFVKQVSNEIVQITCIKSNSFYDYKPNIQYEYSNEFKLPIYEINKNELKVRIGAICNDGTESTSTGRGTCSHHGGVNYWLYE